jgi:hypothetical protein
MFWRPDAFPGGHVSMTEKTSAKKDKKCGKKSRNKTTDAFGNKYDKRKGHWTDLDKAILEEGRLLDSWLTPQRVQVELDLLNVPKKPGRKYEYPPSLILFIAMLKTDDNRSYRRAISKVSTILENLGIPQPHYSTLHKSLEKYNKGQMGLKIISEATVVLVVMGVEEPLDTMRIIHTLVCPDYEAPKIIQTCQKDADRQEQMDDEAETIRDSMHVKVMRSALYSASPHCCAIDGSGEGVSGPGLYFEHIWKVNQRRFIKQHTMLNLENKRVVSYAITLEKPGDAKMLVPLVSGALLVGVKVCWVSADSAYDTIANWKYMDDKGIAFCPNLKESFKGEPELKRRDALASFDEQFGKDLAHRITGYNQRWLIEAFFSIFKTLYGQSVRNRLFHMMVIEMDTRYMLYDIHRDFMIKAWEGALN